MRFSLLLASRQRLELLIGMLESIKSTSVSSEIEVLIAIDSDDLTYNVAELEQDYSSIKLKFFIRERSEWMHKDYINWLYPMSSGKYLIVLNDDTVFNKHGWDNGGWNVLENYLSDKPDGVVYGFTETGSGNTLCTFPLFSRAAVEAVGWILPNERKNWGADHDVYAVYTHPLVNRKIYLPEISVQHRSIHTGSRGRDEISYSIEKSFMTQHNIHIPVLHYAKKISNFIRSHSSKSSSWSNLNINCLLISNGHPDQAIDSVLSQTNKDWELLVINGPTTKKDPRIIHHKMSFFPIGWTINEIFRQGLIHGHLVVCLKDGDRFYENAFQAFLNFFQERPEEYILRCAADVINGGHCGVRRAKERCDASLMQFCLRRDITNVLNPSRTLWPEVGRNLLDHMSQTAKVNMLDIKIGSTDDEF